MTLFSTFIQPQQFFLFLYLGLSSGIFYFSISSLKKIIIKNNNIYFLKNKDLMIKRYLSENNVKQKKMIKNDRKLNKIENKKRKKNIRRKKKQIFISSIKIIIYILKKLENIFLYVLPYILVVVLVFLSYYINLKYNYGYLNLFLIFLWILFLFVGFAFVKIVAKFLLFLYNKCIKKKEVKFWRKKHLQKRN